MTDTTNSVAAVLRPKSMWDVHLAQKYGGQDINTVSNYWDIAGYKRDMGGAGFASQSGLANPFTRGSGSVSIGGFGSGGTPSNPGGYNYATLSGTALGVGRNIRRVGDPAGLRRRDTKNINWMFNPGRRGATPPTPNGPALPPTPGAVGGPPSNTPSGGGSSVRPSRMSSNPPVQQGPTKPPLLMRSRTARRIVEKGLDAIERKAMKFADSKWGQKIDAKMGGDSPPPTNDTKDPFNWDDPY